VQIGPRQQIPVRCGDYFTYPATNPGRFMPQVHSDTSKGNLHVRHSLLAPVSQPWCPTHAGYAEFNSIIYDVTLWVAPDNFPSMEDSEKFILQEKMARPQFISFLVQYVVQLMQAKVCHTCASCCTLQMYAADVTTCCGNQQSGCCHREGIDSSEVPCSSRASQPW
jgi:hypothetical protein